MFVTNIPKNLFLSKKRPGFDYNSELSSINAAWDFSRDHWWDLITFESILFLESLIVSLCLKYLVQSSKWRVELGIWEVKFFPIPEEIAYSFLMYYLLDKRVWFTIIFFLPLSSRYGFFAIPSLILSHLELSRIELPKLTSSILMETLQGLDFLKSLSLS